MRYKHNPGCVYNIKFHLVWCPKYRRNVLTDDIAKRLKGLLYDKAKQPEIKIEAIEIMPDHVHVFIMGEPTGTIQFVVNQPKGYSSFILGNKFSELRSKLPCLWSRSYYVGTVGCVIEAAIRKYIGGEEG